MHSGVLRHYGRLRLCRRRRRHRPGRQRLRFYCVVFRLCVSRHSEHCQLSDLAIVGRARNIWRATVIAGRWKCNKCNLSRTWKIRAANSTSLLAASPAYSAQMRGVVAGVVGRLAWSVCLCAGHDREPCKNDWSDWYVICSVDSCGPKEPHIG